MRPRSLPTFALVLLAASLLVACDLGTSTSGSSAKPTIVIQAPTDGSQSREGEEITIQSVASDTNGVVTVDFFVDGAATGVCAMRGEPVAATTGKHKRKELAMTA